MRPHELGDRETVSDSARGRENDDRTNCGI